MAREAFLLVVIAALAAVSFWSQRTKTPDAVGPAVAAVAGEAQHRDVAAPAAPAPVGRGAPAAKPDHSHELELPDGTFVAALNGAVDPAPLQQFWGSQVPWSPIVGVERNDQGVDWYHHANGSYSTTQMVWRSDLAAYVAMTRVGHPGPAVTPAVGR
jgi:hypothetical protein